MPSKDNGINELMVAASRGDLARLLRAGRVEKPLPALITRAAPAAEGGRDIDLSEFSDHIKD